MSYAICADFHYSKASGLPRVGEATRNLYTGLCDRYTLSNYVVSFFSVSVRYVPHLVRPIVMFKYFVTAIFHFDMQKRVGRVAYF